MFSFFKKKKIVPHIKLCGVIGNVGKFKQGIDFSGQEEIITKAFALKKALCESCIPSTPALRTADGDQVIENTQKTCIYSGTKESDLPEWFLKRELV